MVKPRLFIGGVADGETHWLESQIRVFRIPHRPISVPVGGLGIPDYHKPSYDVYHLQVVGEHEVFVIEES